MTTNFETALPALKEGKRIRRTNWFPNHFIFAQVPATIGKDIVPKMQSLPESVKAFFLKTFTDPSEQIDAIYYNSQIAYVGHSNVITGWGATPEDILANNWEILD